MTYEDVCMEDPFPDIEINYTPKGKFRFSCVTGRKGKILRYFNGLLTREDYFYEPHFKFCPDFINLLTDNCEVVGFWQTEKYFVGISDEIRRQFTFSPFTEKRNMELFERMKTENAVAIHVRKGHDYISDKTWDGTCSRNYYISAINYMKERVDNPQFYIFSDNFDWVKKNIIDIDYTVVDWNPTRGKFNFRDMQLMSCAKHNIISNSSYSWWGAWLNTNPGKIVIAPQIWFNPILEYYSQNNIVCEDWIAL